MRADATDIATSAGWHLYDLDSAVGTATLVRLDETDYRQASFLDERVLGFARRRIEMPFETLAETLRGAPAAPAPHYIFHLGHCGSTLLSRALDASHNTLPLREPLTLRRLASEPALTAAPGLTLALQAHRRGFRTGQTAIVKATSICNGLIGTLLRADPGSHAVLMYVDLETSLAGLLGKQRPARDLDGHLPARLRDWSQIPAAPPLDADRLDEARRAALAWLTGMRHLLEAAGHFGDRVRLVHFEAFLAAPESALAGLADWLGFGADMEALLAAWPDVATGYSKKPAEPYSAFNRRKTLRRGRSERADDIARGLRWAEELVRNVHALAPCAEYLSDNRPPGERG